MSFYSSFSWLTGRALTILNGILHSPQPIPHCILDLGERVLVGAPDEQGHRARVLTLLNEGVFLLSLWKQPHVCLADTSAPWSLINKLDAFRLGSALTALQQVMRSSRTLFQSVTGANIQADVSHPSGFEVFYFTTPALLFKHSVTHQGVLIDEPCVSQAVRSEILHRIHGSATTGQGQSDREQAQLSFIFNKTQSHCQ